MRRRTRVLIAGATLFVLGVLAGAAAIITVTDTRWGHRQIVRFLERQATTELVAGARVDFGLLDGGLNGAWSVGPLALIAPGGDTVARAARVRFHLTIPGILRGNIRLGYVEIDDPRLTLVERSDGRWNVSALRVPSPSASGRALRPPPFVMADSVALRRGIVRITPHGPAQAGVPATRVVSDLNVSLGSTVVSSPGQAGGTATVRALGLQLVEPEIRLVNAQGDVRWWPDSVRLDLPEIRLPRSVASAAGSIVWSDSNDVLVSLDARADTIAFADVQWLSSRIPSNGRARARLTVRPAPGGASSYEVTDVEVESGRSRVSGEAAITVGKRTIIRGFAADVALPDLSVVRAIAGDSIIAPGWNGSVSGRIAGRGGMLDSVLVDSADVRFTDARIGGEVSRVFARGALDISGSVPRLIDVAAGIDPLELRTLGAAQASADSLHGRIVGRVRLDGPTTNVRFSDLHLTHSDGALPRSTLRGSGRIASDRTTTWLEADVTMDTIAVATLAGRATTIPLRGTPRGSATIRAIADTVLVSASVADVDASVRADGAIILDAVRTSLDFTGTITALNPGAFITRRDVPAMRLTGWFAVSIDERPGAPDRHIRVALDSTSTVGDARIAGATLRLGVDETGFHVDTASIVGDTWAIDAHGRLANDSARTDTLSFAATFDSLGVLGTMVLDTLGARRFPDLGGRIRVENGTIVGSLSAATLTADIGAQDLVFGSTSVGKAIGTVVLADLPQRATGTIRGTLHSLAAGSAKADSASLQVRLERGERAETYVRALFGDSTEIRAGATVSWPGDDYVARVDSVEATTHGRRWRLASPATLRMRSDRVELDSLVLRSDRGATVVAVGTVPDSEIVAARVRVTRLGFDEISFLEFVPHGMMGSINVDATISGTRSAPLMSVRATLDSVRSDGRMRPSIALDATYANRKANIVLGATIDGRRVLDARGDVPLDLTLRAVDERVVDAPVSLRLRADSLSLADFEGLAPRIRGLGGSLDGSVDVGGTLRRPRGRGLLTLAGGAFEIPRSGFVARAAAAELELAGDSIVVRYARLADTDSPRDTAAVSGLLRLAGTNWSNWTVELHSVANNFRIIDDPRLATAEADWDLDVRGTLAEPRITGNVYLPYAVFTIGRQRRVRPPVADPTGAARLGIPTVSGVIVSLGSDVRLRSREANVQLAGEVELFGPIDNPWISGSVLATRGTYRVNLNVIQRTFRVDSGVVIVEGTPAVSPALDIYSSYVVKRPDNDDVKISAHLYGTTDRPRLDLSSDLGSASGQSEIISYLVFGQPSFSVPRNSRVAAQTASAAIVPSIGGFLEGVLGTVLPFFSTLQVTSVAGEEAQSVLSSPLGGLLSNNYAVTGGRQIGSDTFFSVTSGWCGSGRVGGGSAPPFWLGTAAEYRPKRSVGATISIDPGPAPCSRVGGTGDTYQIGFDLSYDWKFRRRATSSRPSPP